MFILSRVRTAPKIRNTLFDLVCIELYTKQLLLVNDNTFFTFQIGFELDGYHKYPI